MKSDRSDRSDGSDRSRLRPSGGYRDLRSFQTSTLVYDDTVDFCARFVDRRSRTVDQMVQAARSGRQNIAEGSRASATSSQTELRLVNVARASLDELLLDYEDYLRQRKLPQWGKADPQAMAVREIGRTAKNTPDYSPWLSHADPGIVANTLICLIHQTNYLLDQQIRALERAFVEEGGYSEQLAPPEWLLGGSNRIGRNRLIGPKPRTAHFAASPSFSAPPNKDPKRAPSSGAAPPTRIAKAPGHSLDRSDAIRPIRPIRPILSKSWLPTLIGPPRSRRGWRYKAIRGSYIGFCLWHRSF